MWAVGRLSLLSRGLSGKTAVTPAATLEAPPAPAAPAPSAAASPAPAPMPFRVSAPSPVPVAAPAPIPEGRRVIEPTPVHAAPGLLERIVTRVKGFFRSLFG